MTLNHFSLGKVLLMPEAKPEQTHLIDRSVAEYFFETEHYYAAAMQRLERTLREMEGFIGPPSAASEP
jgi:hypothetical protein